MSSHVHRVRNLPGKLHLSEPPLHDPCRPHRRECRLSLETFDAIGDYTRSMPTAPSAGRIYRKDLHWSGPPSNWFIYLVVNEPPELAGTCRWCNGRKRFRYAGTDIVYDCDKCNGTGVAKPGQLHVPYSAVIV